MGRNFVVTGANRGIGFALTRELLRRGHSVVATAREPGSARALQELAEQYSPECLVEELDVTSDESIAAVERLIVFDAIDALVNNAGVFLDPEDAFEKVPLEKVAETVQTNTIGPMRVTRALLPLLRKSREPIVANISSEIGSLAESTMKTGYGYCMSKAALNMFTVMLAHAYPDLICVSLHPGWVKTDMGGPGATVEPDVSARGLADVLEGLKRADSGKFIAYNGREIPW